MNDLNVGTITFVADPPYCVDFREFQQTTQKAASDIKVKNIAYRCFEQIQYFVQALGSATYSTGSNMTVSFKHIVLGHYGYWNNFRLPSDIYLVAFKVCFWVLALGWCTAATTARLFLEKNRLYATSTGIDIYIDHEIDARHIKTSRLALNAAGVPAEIKVDDLLQVYDAINFSNPNEPGYMSPSSRQEGTSTYEVQNLRKDLETFIQKVKKREAFLGTPPAWDTPRLMAFYQQIEDAVRLSIHKTNSDIEEFLSKNGTDAKDYNKFQLQEYTNLLENKARIAIDLAIAGKHCGARYMGEAMNTYYLICGNDIGSDLTLHDTMVEILAHKRKEIAERQIQEQLGNDTHAYGDYMNSLGALLQLPGTQNIVEQLRRRIDKPKLLRLFFGEYNVNCIITTIQEEIKNKKGNPFRTKIIDWIKDQVRDWKLEEYRQEAIKKTSQVEKILEEKSSDSSSTFEALGHFQDLFTFLKSKSTSLPETGDWNEFLEEVFSLNSAKEWRKIRFPGVSIPLLLDEVRKLKNNLSEERLGKDAAFRLRKQINETGNFAIEELTARLYEIDKIDKIRRIIPLEVGSIERVLKGDVKIKDLIDSQMDLQRRNEFLAQFCLENLASEGVSPELMEWLLVSQNILLTQV